MFIKTLSLTQRHAALVVAGSVLLLLADVLPSAAQDDVTTRNGSSAYDGAWITGPASNPLSFLNGPAYRTFGSAAPYDFPDFRPSSRLNERLPKWINFAAEDRFRYEGYHNGGFKLNDNDSYALNRFRLQMSLMFTPWFKVVSQVQDARPFLQKPPYGPPNEVRWDLKLAYVEFGDPEKHWVSLRVGRQMINYNNTIVANSEWRNQGRSYDAAVVNLHYHRFRLGIFAASIVNPEISGLTHHQEGNNIHGLYGRISSVIPNSELEPFVLWRVAPSVAVETTANAKTGKLDEKAYGIRFKGRAITNLDYSFEIIAERGSAGFNTIRAWATTLGSGYRIDRAPWHPRAFAQYDFASGDRNPTDGTHGAFDTMYPTAHDRFGITDQFGWQNIVAARVGLTIEPHRRWSITGQFLDFWLASAIDSLYNTSGGSVVRDKTGISGAHVGKEA
ncbi:MAG TPA: alginate export family protein, partial [Candidatus Acidoferrales bacterium]|nr:alginate export family protein [Candidatus Acidoferrales bacterium]